MIYVQSRSLEDKACTNMGHTFKALGLLGDEARGRSPGVPFE